MLLTAPFYLKFYLGLGNTVSIRICERSVFKLPH